MLRVVFDVNVLISALITKGKPKELWLKSAKEFELTSSEQILADFIRVIGRAKFQPYVRTRDLQDFLEAFHLKAVFINVKSRFKVVEADPDDDIILNTVWMAKPTTSCLAISICWI